MPTYQELVAQKAALDAQIEAARTAEVSAAVATVKQLIGDFSLTAADCGFSAQPKAKTLKAKNESNPAKYVGPAGETWSGRGRPPAWIVAADAAGRTRAEFLIQ